jgi:hypothetical protein
VDAREPDSEPARSSKPEWSFGPSDVMKIFFWES